MGRFAGSGGRGCSASPSASRANSRARWATPAITGCSSAAAAVHTNLFGTRQPARARPLPGTSYSRLYNLSYTDPYVTMDGMSVTGFHHLPELQPVSSAPDRISDTTTASASAEVSYPITELQRPHIRRHLAAGPTSLPRSTATSSRASGCRPNGRPYERNGAGPWRAGSRKLYYGSKFNSLETAAGAGCTTAATGFFSPIAGNAPPPVAFGHHPRQRRGVRQRPLPVHALSAVPGPALVSAFASTPMWVFSEAFGDTTAVPPYKHFYGGGPDSVRGFKEYRLGPKDRFRQTPTAGKHAGLPARWS